MWPCERDVRRGVEAGLWLRGERLLGRTVSLWLGSGDACLGLSLSLVNQERPCFWIRIKTLHILCFLLILIWKVHVLCCSQKQAEWNKPRGSFLRLVVLWPDNQHDYLSAWVKLLWEKKVHKRCPQSVNMIRQTPTEINKNQWRFQRPNAHTILLTLAPVMHIVNIFWAIPNNTGQHLVIVSLFLLGLLTCADDRHQDQGLSQVCKMRRWMQRNNRPGMPRVTGFVENGSKIARPCGGKCVVILVWIGHHHTDSGGMSICRSMHAHLEQRLNRCTQLV